ncbi:F-type H+-transporting ATPase subunit b [Sphingomonas jinjuensis]|uniref:ATP synthase subunit b n=1 Tax=Sphingomonas jinjuensis TaxID=535907 RepID=A0A840F5L2_9SPHN|nr:hypothetical protein [Sphingomonas jinjuensis]MBB4154563.1 F-type H+-transporting ATPase subunit b [Sphingomonas jinjuensis]
MANPTAPIAATLPENALHVEPAVFGISASGFVALSMLVVIGIILWKKVPALVGRALDAKIASIRHDLDEAKSLRVEAEAMLAEAKKRDAAAQNDAAAIVAHAQQDAEAMLAKAKVDAAELVRRRTQMAEDKIGAAERSALAEVRGRAAAAAAGAAAAIIAERHTAEADRVLVDRAIAGIGRAH